MSERPAGPGGASLRYTACTTVTIGTSMSGSLRTVSGTTGNLPITPMLQMPLPQSDHRWG